MIIVACTSWHKRIKNIPKVIFSLLRQTIKADLIELNLCTEDFPHKEKDLPDEVNLLIDNSILHVNWVDENTYTFKKFIPTLQKHYGENYHLITIDDDKLYDRDYIEYLMSNIQDADVFCGNGRNYVCGGLMIYKSSIFEKDFWERLTNDIIETKIDDTYINYYLKYRNAKFGSSLNIKKWKPYNECHPTHDYYRKENRIKIADELSKDLWR